ncbi:unnamed protein product [Rhodiola kirilowii]
MASFIAVVVGLSFVFGVLMVAIAAELYYLIRWKKKPLTAREIDEVNTSYVQELLYVLSSRQQAEQSSSLHTSQHRTLSVSDPEMGSSRNLLLKQSAEESVESELMRLHNLAGPPRFLFTIKEETKEDLDSEDRSRKGSRTRSLSDVIVTCETPFLTPIASPKITSPVLNHPSLEFYGFNPLYEAASFEEIESKLKQSPPPKFKFLRDAEEKLYRRMKEQMLKNSGSGQHPGINNSASTGSQEEQIGSLITLISGVKKDKEVVVHHNSGSSKILPLASSPTRFRLHAT